MANLSRLFLVFLLAYLSFLPSVHALLFERRKIPEPEISWFVYPVVGSIPGVQDFYGLGATVSSIGGTDSDITAISLRGKAEYFDDDFKIDILSIFFFQAEDGIRDLVRSRGLGDVYKRQGMGRVERRCAGELGGLSLIHI